MQRIPEVELMDDFEQARAYARADFSEPHDHFIELLKQKFPNVEMEGTALDLGCGAADITVRFAAAFPACRIHALDGSEQMLAFAQQRIDGAMLQNRVQLIKSILPVNSLPSEKYAAIFCNSLLHHLEDPLVLWRTIGQFAADGALIFVMDLIRSASPEAAQELVKRYAAAEAEILQRDFYNSLLAAFTPEEVREQLSAAGMERFELEIVSDRHMVASGRW